MISSISQSVEQLQQENADKELHWLIEDVIGPEFPQIIETLQMCLNLILYNSPQHPDPHNHIEKGPSIKLPVSSNKTEEIKGIVSRDGAYITQMTVQFKERHFNKIVHRLNLSKPVLLTQLIDAKKSIDTAIELIETSRVVLKECHDTHDSRHLALVQLFKQLVTEVHHAKMLLQLPSDPALVFPIHVMPAEVFEPPLPPLMSFDMYVSQAEVCIDVKSLHRVTELPWGDIDTSSGLSYIDRVRDEMKLPPSHASVSPSPGPDGRPLNMNDVESRLNELNKPQQHNIFNKIGNLLLRKYEPIDYITKCITYNNQVVMVNKKIEVSSPDPVLVSAFTKLDSIEYLVTNFLDNIQSVMNVLL